MAYGLLLGCRCRSGLDAGPFKTFFLTMFEKSVGQKPGKSSPSVRVWHRNRSGVVDLVGREPVMFAKVENGVTKSCQKISPEKQKKPFWPEIFHFFEQDMDSLLFARVENGVTEYLTKTSRFFLCLRFISKVGVRTPFSMGNLNFHFLAAEKLTLGGV